MGLLDKLEQVEIKADSRLPEDDLMFCETQQQAYDESCRALREIRQQWKKAIQAQRDLLGIGQDGSLPYFGSNYRFGITDLNRELEKFHSRFISELTQHFNEKYSVTISTDAIKEHLIPAEPDPYRCDMDTSKEYHRNLRDLSLHYEDVVDQMFIQLDGLSFVERAFQELRTKCHKAAYWSNSNAGYDMIRTARRHERLTRGTVNRSRPIVVGTRCLPIHICRRKSPYLVSDSAHRTSTMQIFCVISSPRQ